MITRALALVLSATIATCVPVPQMMMPSCCPPQIPMMQCCQQMPMMPCCQQPQQMMMPSLPYQKTPYHPPVYAPLPGEIVFKLVQNWDDEFTNTASPNYQILEGNIRSAIQKVLGPMTQVTNIYFREGQVPGNPPSRPKVVAHMMVDGGSDAASVLERSVTPDGTLGDGLKVFKDSFNAY